MGFGDFCRLGKIARFQESDRDERTFVGCAGRPDCSMFLMQYSRVELVALPVLLKGPRAHFLGAAFLVGLGKPDRVLAKNENELVHGF